jgi:hypothetical protein
VLSESGVGKARPSSGATRHLLPALRGEGKQVCGRGCGRCALFLLPAGEQEERRVRRALRFISSPRHAGRRWRAAPDEGLPMRQRSPSKHHRSEAAHRRSIGESRSPRCAGRRKATRVVRGLDPRRWSGKPRRCSAMAPSVRLQAASTMKISPTFVRCCCAAGVKGFGVAVRQPQAHGCELWRW